MRKSKIIATLVAGGVSVAALNALGQTEPAQNPRSLPAGDYNSATSSLPAGGYNSSSYTGKGMKSNMQCDRASHLIGMEVRTGDGDHLGRVQDLVVSLATGQTPMAIVKEGGALGIGGVHIAVPLRELKLSEDGKALTLNATKEQFTSSSTTPSGGWANFSGEEWAKNIDRYYGQPTFSDNSRFERQEFQGTTTGRESVRTPAGTQPSTTDPSLQTPSNRSDDSNIKKQVDRILERKLHNHSSVNADVDNGVVTLKGKLDNSQSKMELENEIKSLPGVNRVDNQTTAKNE